MRLFYLCHSLAKGKMTIGTFYTLLPAHRPVNRLEKNKRTFMATRPTILDPLFSPITTLNGVGPKVALKMGKLFYFLKPEQDVRILDILLHMPINLIDRRNQPGIAMAEDGQIVTLKVIIDEHRPPPRGNRRVPYKIAAHDESGTITLVFFHSHGDYLLKQMPLDSLRYISGKIEIFDGFPQITHPDHILDEEAFGKMPLVETIYPMTAGLSPKTLSKSIRASLELIPEFDEWIDKAIIGREKWPDFKTALEFTHTPPDSKSFGQESPSWLRLAYDELLASQLALALVREKVRRVKGIEKTGTGHLKRLIIDALPFDLTCAQERAIAEIEGDMASKVRMVRLLQGDVGAGKTVIGLMAMVRANESGFQSALMAPTELLARQHYKTIKPLADAAGLNVAILTGREKGQERRDILEGLEEGTIHMVAGTHALFQESAIFKKLGLVIIDEQHRFGVQQRLALSNKGQATDLLAMTATPIPRTLVMTYFGDMDVSRLADKPKGRLPIETRTISLDRLADVASRIKDAIEDGKKAYWVCPLVEENEELNFTAAEERFQSLYSLLGDKVALVHGQMPAEEKEKAMQRFQKGDARLLVATTVIEVGVDVPDATIMVIEHAERFGLAQLHQLRGRVGRGQEQSTCLLLYKGPLGETSRARLQIMKDSEDGFLIAEEDLRLRGEGDLLGTKQSGIPGFKIADLTLHAHLLELARDDAKLFLTKDPALASPRGKALRNLLYIFDRADAIRLLRAG